jgi:hypothetical protein
LPTLRNIGLALFLGGLLILLGYGGVEILIAAETPFVLKLGFLAILIGILVLIITLIKEQTTEDEEGVDRKY